MIVSIRHKGLKEFFESGSIKGVKPMHKSRLRLQLAALDSARVIADMNLPGWNLHGLKGFRPERWSVSVDKNWRLTFEFQNGNAELVDYEDYH